jgi:tRNA_anti-like
VIQLPTMTPQDSHHDNAKTKPKAKKRQPVKKHDPQAQQIAATFVIIGCVGAVAIGVLAYYHADTPLVWVTFLTVAVFLIAIYFHWRSPGVQALCTSLGVVLFVGCLIWQYRLSFPKHEASSTVSTPTPSPAKANSSPNPVAAPEERVLLDVKPEYLLDFFTKYNNVQAQKLVETYIGKWMKISGEVSDVFPSETSGGTRLDRGPSVMMTKKAKKASGDIDVFCDFDDQRWKDRAAVLKRGDKITVFGQITRIDRFFTLTKCEFVE